MPYIPRYRYKYQNKNQRILTKKAPTPQKPVTDMVILDLKEIQKRKLLEFDLWVNIANMYSNSSLAVAIRRFPTGLFSSAPDKDQELRMRYIIDCETAFRHEERDTPLLRKFGVGHMFRIFDFKKDNIKSCKWDPLLQNSMYTAPNIDMLNRDALNDIEKITLDIALAENLDELIQAIEKYPDEQIQDDAGTFDKNELIIKIQNAFFEPHFRQKLYELGMQAFLAETEYDYLFPLTLGIREKLYQLFVLDSHKQVDCFQGFLQFLEQLPSDSFIFHIEEPQHFSDHCFIEIDYEGRVKIDKSKLIKSLKEDVLTDSELKKLIINAHQQNWNPCYLVWSSFIRWHISPDSLAEKIQSFLHKPWNHYYVNPEVSFEINNTFTIRTPEEPQYIFQEFSLLDQIKTKLCGNPDLKIADSYYQKQLYEIERKKSFLTKRTSQAVYDNFLASISSLLSMVKRGNKRDNIVQFPEWILLNYERLSILFNDIDVQDKLLSTKNLFEQEIGMIVDTLKSRNVIDEAIRKYGTSSCRAKF